MIAFRLDEDDVFNCKKFYVVSHSEEDDIIEFYSSRWELMNAWKQDLIWADKGQYELIVVLKACYGDWGFLFKAAVLIELSDEDD